MPVMLCSPAAAGPGLSGLPPFFNQQISECREQWCEPEGSGDSAEETNVLVLMELTVSPSISCSFHNNLEAGYCHIPILFS